MLEVYPSSIVEEATTTSRFLRMAIGSYRTLLCSKGFMAFLVTQFLGAFNDNLYKMVVQLLVLSRGFAAHAEHALLSLASIIFILPGILFSGYAGYFADIYS